jgi:BirA family transcriptional regulator, biotin operon repressor / biotin---[acetyl-CoA-carboxylase] ligase
VIEAGAPVFTFASLDSTNEEAKRRAEAGDCGPCWLLALTQTAGRGRRGRSWESAHGALFATYLGHSAAPPQHIAWLGFAAAVAVAQALAQAGVAGAQLKWPNDVLLHGGKVGGVLLESSRMPGGGHWFALGIGVNLAAAPVGLDRAVSGAGAALAPEGFLQTLAGRLGPLSKPLNDGDFSALRTVWLGLAAGLGQAVTTQVNGETLNGMFADLDADGALALDTAQGRVRITAGEIYFPNQP